MAPPGRPTLAPLLLLLSGPAAAGAFAPPPAARRAQPFLLPPLRFGPAIGTFGDGGEEEEVRPPGVPADADADAVADAVAAMDAAAWEADALEAALAADAKEAAEDAAAAAAMAGSQQTATAPAQAAPPPPPPAAPGQDVMTAPASTTPQLMATIWEVIAQGPTMTRGVSSSQVPLSRPLASLVRVLVRVLVFASLPPLQHAPELAALTPFLPIPLFPRNQPSPKIPSCRTPSQSSSPRWRASSPPPTSSVSLHTSTRARTCATTSA